MSQPNIQVTNFEAIRQYLAAIGKPITVVQAQEVMARACGFKNKHVLVDYFRQPAMLEKHSGLPNDTAESFIAIPILNEKTSVGLSAKEYTELSFEIGSLDREGLLSLCDDLGGAGLTTGSYDELRSRALELLAEQGAPHVQLELQPVGCGVLDQVMVYVPKSHFSPETMSSPLFSHENGSPILQTMGLNAMGWVGIPGNLPKIVYYNSEELFTADGDRFVQAKDYGE